VINQQTEVSEMNQAQMQFWNGFYHTARSIGMSVAESIYFADLQLAKATK
jgi:hypothetical protein